MSFNHVTMEAPKAAPPAPKTHQAVRRSDGVYLWFPVSTSAKPDLVEPRDLWPGGESMSREDYEKAHRARQQEHLKNVADLQRRRQWQPCLHDTCNHCLGTGIKRDGSQCVHTIVCTCMKCIAK